MGHIQINLGNMLRISGLSQAQLARRTGLRPATIHALATGKVKRVELDTLARVLDGLWDELGMPFAIENLLRFESERRETLPDGAVIATNHYGRRHYVSEDGEYKPAPRKHEQR